ncbi:hypothetical protein EI613_10005 [Azospirillum sp. 412522]|nr:hypothetical protein [Azospirillum sp. 412522]MBY6262246.1 hypothetical protein [Azospirillum sp. 412522]
MNESSDAIMSAFSATLIGTAVGVVAGTLVQYFVEIVLSWSKRRGVLSDIKNEAAFNKAVLEQLLAELGRYRALAQPNMLGNYLGYFKAGSGLWLSMNTIISSGHLYKTFKQNEILMIQKLNNILSPGNEKWINEKVEQIKASGNIAEALNFANYLEQQFREGLETVGMIIDKKW